MCGVEKVGRRSIALPLAPHGPKTNAWRTPGKQSREGGKDERKKPRREKGSGSVYAVGNKSWRSIATRMAA
jgi:hypothetical protein